MNVTSRPAAPGELRKHLSPMGAWAFAVGTSVGWGSLVVTANTYLAQAGPLGTVLGLVVGALIMLVMCRNYAYMIQSYPEAGGAYAYTKEVFGYDHGFLTAWFLALTYLAMFWANATSLPLFARYFLGTFFEFGKLYTVFGYDVYLGEALLSMAGIALTALLCARRERLASAMMTALAALFSVGIAVCFAGSFLGLDHALQPAFVPDAGALGQIVKIACISPWAFIGFENISHAAEEFSFERTRIHRILVAAVLSTTALYLMVTLLSVTAYPERYDSWLSYIRDLGSLDGIEALPAFYAARHYMGSAGVVALMLALLALVVTSLIGNTFALSRLLYAQAKDEILPVSIGRLNSRGVPSRAILLIAAVSILVPLVGRTAVGWIVDVTTLGATLVYAFVSAAAFKLARDSGDRREKITGLVGLVLLIGIGLYLLVPNLFGASAMETESYFLFVVWAVLGFISFRVILARDKRKRFGRSIIVWVALLSLVLFVSLVWMSQATMNATTTAMNHLQARYAETGFPADQTGFIAQELSAIRTTNARSIAVVVFVFALSLGLLLNNYNLMSRRAQESEQELDKVKNLANTDPLTGIKSKRAFAEMEREMDERIAGGTVDAFAVVMCDLNGLKHVNDTQGHKAGDEYIREGCRMVCEFFKHSPVFRVGGDEFTALLTGRDYETRAELLEALRRRSEENIALGRAVISAGMSDYQPGHDAAIHPVFERADTAMYTEKQRLKQLGAHTR